MVIEVRRCEYGEVAALRELYRHEANCQIVHDSVLARELADPYLILGDGRVAAYGGVWNKYDAGMVMEFYALPCHRGRVRNLFQEFLSVSGATAIEAQTNMPLMLTLLHDFTEYAVVRNILFGDTGVTNLSCPTGTFRRTRPADNGPDREADWGLEVNGKIVASGGFLTHYNPPYGDIYMVVAESERQKGLGSYLVQELKRVCYESGRKPSARCDPTNLASRRTLEKAGLMPCGRLLAGNIPVARG